jgi:hypothetical protein
MELELNWERALRIWWSFTWRMIIGGIAVFLIEEVLVWLIGFSIEGFGVSPISVDQYKRIASQLIGLAFALALPLIIFKFFLFRVDFGQYRIALLSKDSP